MIIIANAEGTVVKTVPSPIRQGAINANSVFLIAPFPAESVVYFTYELPTGEIFKPITASLSDYEMAMLGELLEGKEGKYNCWYKLLNAPFTSHAGTVKIQFNVVNGESVLPLDPVYINVPQGTGHIDDIDSAGEVELNSYTEMAGAIQEQFENYCKGALSEYFTHELGLKKEELIAQLRDGYFHAEYDEKSHKLKLAINALSGEGTVTECEVDLLDAISISSAAYNEKDKTIDIWIPDGGENIKIQIPVSELVDVIGKKLDKIDNKTSSSCAYVAKPNNEGTELIPVIQGDGNDVPKVNSIVRRTSKGQVIMADPKYNYHGVNLRYLNERIGGLNIERVTALPTQCDENTIYFIV